MWNRSYKVRFGSLAIHAYPCKLSESFKQVYPRGLTLYNLLLTERVDVEVAEILREVAGVAQVISNTGAYNIIIEIPSTFEIKNVIALCMLAIHGHYTSPKSSTSSYSNEKVVVQ